ncbi:hypothetical protein LPZ50_21610, partial [Bordetella petrii]|nr:hypothetical protein [Bordetella petrii]
MNRLRAVLRHLLVWWLPLPIMLVVLLCGFALWLTGTQQGTRMLLGAVAEQFDGSAENVRGTLLGSLQVGRLHLILPGTEVDIADLRLDVHWRALGQRQLHVRELSAGDVQVALTSAPESESTGEPLVLPELPVSLALDRLALGALHLSIDGTPLPLGIGELAGALSADAHGARLRLASLRLDHAQAIARLQGQAQLMELAAPWPLWAQLNIDARGVGPDSPLCASRMLQAKSAEAAGKAARPAKTKAKASDKNKQAGQAAGPDAAAAPQDQACTAAVRVYAEGSMQQMDVRLDGATADGALTLLAQAGLELDQPFPLRTANLDLRLADKSGMVATLDRQPQVLQPGVDRVVATLDAERLDLGRLLGDAIPPALLSARMAVDAQVAGTAELRQAYVQATIAEGSRWNRQALSGTLKGRVDALPAAAGQAPAASVAAGPADPLAGFELQDLQLDVRLGRNRVRAQGELSQGNADLTLDADTPRLDAFWPGLPGGAAVKGTLRGRLEQHQGRITARYTPADSRADTLGKAPMRAELEFAGGWGPGPGPA